MQQDLQFSLDFAFESAVFLATLSKTWSQVSKKGMPGHTQYTTLSHCILQNGEDLKFLQILFLTCNGSYR